MTAAIAHRGPDGAGLHASGSVALGHRRLSIIDLSDMAHQPMVSVESDLALTFNGEIYNYLELRNELEALGARFQSAGDTAVLLEAYRHWGPDCVRRFNGMWAFAVLDKRRNTLFASRDRFGIKPFYYAANSERFAFCSELKGLAAALPELRRPDMAALRRFLPSGILDDGEDTVFAGVRQLPPAHSLTLDLATGAIRTERYWTVDPDAFRAKWKGIDPVEALRGLLRDAVALHMRSDVPVGICLSGGLDSSALLGLMGERSHGPVRAYSGLFADKGCDEGPYVAAMRARGHAAGASIHPEPDGNLLDDLARITWAQDMPSAGPGLYTQFHVMRRASEDVKVLLDGQGADELFGGYLTYYGLRVDDLGGTDGFLAAHRLILQVLRHFGMGALGSAQGPLSVRLGRVVLSRLRRARGETAPPLFGEALEEPFSTAAPSVYPDRFSARLQEDLAARSIPALLHFEDRNSMAFGLESRVPFLDVRLAEFALGLDPGFKIRDGWTKWVLRKAAEPWIPPAIAWRRSKLGYATPAGRWMREGRNRDALVDLLFSGRARARGMISPEAVEFWWKQHQEDRTDNSWQLWRLATLELWFRHFIDAFDPRPARHTPPVEVRTSVAA